MMKKSLKLKFLQIGCILGGLLLGLSCSRGVPDSPVLRVRLASEPVSLDPTLAEDGAALMILNNTMEGLFGYDSKGQFEKRLAERFEITSQGLEYRFWIKKGALWSDGQPVVARDFVVAIRRALDSQSFSKLGVFFRVISSIREDRGGIVVRLKHKTPYFLQLLTLPVAFPQREDVLKSHGGIWPDLAPVTGPYRILSHERDQKIRLEKNPLYPGDPPSVDQVDFLIVSDESTAIHLFESRQLDVIQRLQSMDLARLKKKGWIHSDPFLATYFLAFNCRKPPFNDWVWRQAVSGAIQREQITTLLGTEDRAAWSYIPPGLEGYEPYRNPQKVFSTAIEQVQKLKKSMPEIRAGFDHQDKNLRVMEKVQSDLQSQLGIQLSLSHMDWKTYLKTLQTQPPDLFRFGFQAPFLDPIVHLKTFTTESLYNFTGCSSREYDQRVAEIEQLEPGSLREKKIHQAQQILLEKEAMLVPLYHYTSHSVVAQRVKGFQLNPFGVLLLKDLRLQKERDEHVDSKSSFK